VISFERFFTRIHGHDPYPWQRRLATRCAAGELPSVIAVPTGSGKTATVDALLWALASQAERPAAERTVGTRIVWAIDRRILVDEVHDHAERLAHELADALAAPRHELQPVAAALARLGGGGIPLVATRWRGGIEPDRVVPAPSQPQVITSTVAQAASRLLFRGYGVAMRSRALAAGLIGTDTTICLDEAHLAEPFRETIAAIGELRDPTGALPALRAITLTATPPEPRADDTLVLDADDRADLALRRRLHGVKRAMLVEPQESGDRARVAALVDATLGHVERGAATVACVVNTVQQARAVQGALQAALTRHRADEEIACELLVGPQRQFDRRDFLRGSGARLFDREAGSSRVVCVATQTFEVGLDADVDALVTESASASALVQRLGRLNRTGASTTAHATIVRDAGSWLYGEDEELAWRWLRAAERDGGIDVSVAALDALLPLPRASEPPGAPLLPEETVERLVCSDGALGPWQDLDIEPYWRGAEQRPAADVSICWRADLRPELRTIAANAYRELLLDLVPPQRDELLTLSLRAAQALLVSLRPAGSRAAAAKAALADGDVEGGEAPGRAPEHQAETRGVPFLIMRGDAVRHGAFDRAALNLLLPGDLRAGDVVVLPAGAAADPLFGADDRAGDVAPADDGSVAPVRINPEALQQALGGERLGRRQWTRVSLACARVSRAVAVASSAAERELAVAGLVTALREQLPPHAGLDALAEQPPGLLSLRELGVAGLDGVPAFHPGDGEEPAAEAADEDLVDGSEERGDPLAVGREVQTTWVLTAAPVRRRDFADRPAGARGRPPALGDHLDAVAERAGHYADVAGLPQQLAETLRLAAAFHDLGKADPRIQAFYRRGVRTFGALPLAKSEFGADDRAGARIAGRLAGLPRKLHHERLSVAMVVTALDSGALALPDGVDRDLLLHLIAAHHGRGRPSPERPSAGSPPASFAFAHDRREWHGDGGDDDGWEHGTWAMRFFAAHRRYGAWTVAYLEALLMLADRAVSAEGS
jgi:CRISPR-associated endonuclease/helicase Cas3